MDSLYLVLPIIGGTWVPLDVPASNVYEWWTNGQDEPILRFTTNIVLGNEVVTAIEYRDIYRGLDAGIEELSVDYSIYPNPVVNELTISSKEKITAINLIDMNGNLIESLKIDSVLSTTVNVAHLPTGAYQIQLFSDTKSAVKSFIKR